MLFASNNVQSLIDASGVVLTKVNGSSSAFQATADCSPEKLTQLLSKVEDVIVISRDNNNLIGRYRDVAIMTNGTKLIGCAL